MEPRPRRAVPDVARADMTDEQLHVVARTERIWQAGPDLLDGVLESLPEVKQVLTAAMKTDRSISEDKLKAKLRVALMYLLGLEHTRASRGRHVEEPLGAWIMSTLMNAVQSTQVRTARPRSGPAPAAGHSPRAAAASSQPPAPQPLPCSRAGGVGSSRLLTPLRGALRRSRSLPSTVFSTRS
mgnify:CR=1 FL=1